MKKIKIKQGEVLSAELLAKKLGLDYGLTDEEYGDGDVEELEVDWEWEEDEKSKGNSGSIGLTYELTKDGTAYRVVSIGDCIDGNVVIPESFQGLPITEVKARAFENCEQIKSLVIPNSVKKIGKNIIAGCVGLERLVIPFIGEREENSKGRKSCFGYFFDGDSNYNEECLPSILQEVVITGGEKLSGGTFVECDSIKRIVLPPTLREIEEGHEFHSCDLEEIMIPARTEKIPVGTFAYCHNLKNIVVAEENEWYKSVDGSLYTKDGRTLLRYAGGKTNERFEIPSGVQTVADFAFSWSEYLKEVVVPSSVEKIGLCAFDDCKKLEKITLAEGIKEIETMAFTRTNLSSLHLPSTLEKLGSLYHISENYEKTTVDEKNLFFKAVDGVLYSKDGKRLLYYPAGKRLSHFDIPFGVEVIEEGAVYYNRHLESITIPKSVRKICENSLDCENLKTLVVPLSVEEIEEFSFGYFEKIYFEREKDVYTKYYKVERYSFSGELCTSKETKKYFYSETKPTEKGYFWHYGENGEVVEWEETQT